MFKKLFSRLSWSHFLELIKIDDELKRSFYEIECIKNNWSVRKLVRQKNSILFERIGLSKNKEKIFIITALMFLNLCSL
ncbi:DUF1016 N-terminal domain-containing protein [Candidatus Uabimicrobium sp. HlEnr_7]|uniref:DUF1016 N-terminal domain-containing protein n=1 Tax=Candidatus Uabimicrobium helgolandensis TaxID=3095367 RepID=UPI003558E6A0